MLRISRFASVVIAIGWWTAGCVGGKQTGPDAGSTTGGSVASGGSSASGGSMGSGGMVASGGSMGSGGATGSGGTVSSACSAVVDAFEAELGRVQSCSEPADCGQAIAGTSCGCTRNLVARADADLTELHRLLKQEVDGDRCVQLVSSCDCPQADGFTCQAGRCAWNYTDPVDCCLASGIRWGSNGGLVDPATVAQYTLSGCGAFARVQGGAHCESELPDCGVATIDGAAINAAIAHPDVQKALMQAPIVYGVDARALDGTVDRVEVDGKMFEVGYACPDDSDCIEIPSGIEALMTLLAGLVEQQTSRGQCKVVPACSLPVEPGPCRGSIARFYYDAKTGMCEPFTYGGCGGNQNNFATEKACQALCGPVGDPCTQPKVVGSCEAAIPRFYFDSRQAKCLSFTYGGCDGNANNFETKEDCAEACEATADPCTLGAAVGECDAALPRYFFNTRSARCEMFVYGGCGGNGNNFETLEACEGRCAVRQDKCYLPRFEGWCSNLEQRYYFDGVSGTCKTLNYTGCGGNENNFATIADCQADCLGAK